MRLPLLLYLTSSLASCLPSNTNDKHHHDQQQAILQNEPTTSSTIRDSLLASAIIPEVLDDFEPLYYIDITWAKHDDKVLMGNKIKVKHVQKRPTFTVHEIEGPNPSVIQNRLNKVYTLVLTDPDAKSRKNPKWSEMCHWIMTNLTTPLPGTPPASPFSFDTDLEIDDLDEDLEVDKVDGELVEYKPPGPPPKTGAHRYVFVLLEGDGDTTADLKPPKERMHWGYGKVRHGVRDWAEENGLTVVGANYFYAKNKKQ